MEWSGVAERIRSRCDSTWLGLNASLGGPKSEGDGRPEDCAEDRSPQATDDDGRRPVGEKDGSFADGAIPATCS